MAAQQRRVQLRFGATAAEVGTEGDLDVLKKQIESQLGLQPDSYGLFDACGEVATPAALLRSLCAAGEERCQLEVRERPVWKRIRELEAALQAAGAAPPSAAAEGGGAALEALEQRILGKVESMVSDMGGRLRRLEAGMGQGGPLLESIALEQISTREKVATLDASIGPLLQSLAMEQMDLKASLSKSVASLRSVDALEDSITKKMDDLAQLELKLQGELAGLEQNTRTIQGLEKKVSQLQAKAAGAGAAAAGAGAGAASPKGGRAPAPREEPARGGAVSFTDTDAAWPGTAAAAGLAPPGAAMFAYSTKVSPLGGAGAAFRVPVAAAPFARGDPGARLRERRMLPSTSLSLPSLPPLQA